MGGPSTVSVFPATEAATPEFVNVTSTDDAAAGVFAPITTTTVVALAYAHDSAAVLVVATLLPTLAVHAEPEIKLAPVTVMVLPAYADKGAIEAAVGSALTVSVVPATVATLAPFVNVTSTDDAAAAVPAPITTAAEVALTYVHVAAVPELGVAPTLALQAKPEMKFVPVTVMVLPT